MLNVVSAAFGVEEASMSPSSNCYRHYVRRYNRKLASIILKAEHCRDEEADGVDINLRAAGHVDADGASKRNIYSETIIARLGIDIGTSFRLERREVNGTIRRQISARHVGSAVTACADQ